MSKKYHYQEIRVRGVGNKTVSEIHNIADNLGISVSAFLKPELIKIINTYPSEMRDAKQNKD